MISTARVHAQLSMAATENLSGDEADGKRDLGKATEKRTELRADLEARAARAADLSEEMKDAGDTSFWQDVGDFFTGNDRVGKVAEKQADNEANMERQQHELEIVKAEANDILSELEKSQGDLQGTHNALEEILKDSEQTHQVSSLG